MQPVGGATDRIQIALWGGTSKCQIPCRSDAHGGSLHAKVLCGALQRQELERLCHYIALPAITNERRLWRNSDVSCGSGMLIA
jgi:hypothetical protein